MTPSELQPMTCSFCGAPMPQENTIPARGWAIRADGKMVWCPVHMDEKGDA